MTFLTSNAEKLLREILDVYQRYKGHDSQYWENRFNKLSIGEDALLRSAFKELEDAEMITTLWADDIPCELVVLNKGVSYFEMKNREEQEKKKEKRSERSHELMTTVTGGVTGSMVSTILKHLGIGG